MSIRIEVSVGELEEPKMRWEESRLEMPKAHSYEERGRLLVSMVLDIN
jgi:hypothetical protein